MAGVIWRRPLSEDPFVALWSSVFLLMLWCPHLLMMQGELDRGGQREYVVALDICWWLMVLSGEGPCSQDDAVD